MHSEVHVYCVRVSPDFKWFSLQQWVFDTSLLKIANVIPTAAVKQSAKVLGPLVFLVQVSPSPKVSLDTISRSRGHGPVLNQLGSNYKKITFENYVSHYKANGVPYLLLLSPPVTQFSFRLTICRFTHFETSTCTCTNHSQSNINTTKSQVPCTHRIYFFIVVVLFFFGFFFLVLFCFVFRKPKISVRLALCKTCRLRVFAQFWDHCGERPQNLHELLCHG